MHQSFYTKRCAAPEHWREAPLHDNYQGNKHHTQKFVHFQPRLATTAPFFLAMRNRAHRPLTHAKKTFVHLVNIPPFVFPCLNCHQLIGMTPDFVGVAARQLGQRDLVD